MIKTFLMSEFVYQLFFLLVCISLSTIHQIGSDMALESFTGFQYITLLGNFSIPIKRVIQKSIFTSSLETGKTGLVHVACEISLLCKIVWNVIWFSISSVKNKEEKDHGLLHMFRRLSCCIFTCNFAFQTKNFEELPIHYNVTIQIK